MAVNGESGHRRTQAERSRASREVDARYGLGLVIEGLRAVFATGHGEPRPVEPLAHLLLAALNEAAMLVAGATDPVGARTELGVLVDHLLDALLQPVR